MIYAVQMTKSTSVIEKCECSLTSDGWNPLNQMEKPMYSRTVSKNSTPAKNERTIWNFCQIACAFDWWKVTQPKINIIIKM